MRKFVLLVDDDDTTLHMMARLLEARGFPSLTASSGELALECLAERGGEIGLVLLDLAMPRMNGYDLARAIRSRPEYADISLVALTARTDSAATAQAIQAGITQVLGKPFDPAALRGLLAELLPELSQT